jgi:hypothetical protein
VLVALLATCTLGWAQLVGLGEDETRLETNNTFAPKGPRLSPASLDLDTCGCPTTFGDPECDVETSWGVEKTTESGPYTNPDGEAFLFDVKVTEGPTSTILSGEGRMVISNSGEQTPSLASVLVMLEDQTPNQGDAPGGSGRNWTILSAVAESEAQACNNSGIAVTCDKREERAYDLSEGGNLVLFDCDNNNDIIALSDRVLIEPTQDNDGDGDRDEDPVYTGLNDTANSCDIIDNDGDGLYDEDPIDFDPFGNPINNDGDNAYNEDDPDDDGDGLTDEDGACEDAVEICFTYEFDISGMDLEGPGDGVVPSDDDLRIDLLVTFDAMGTRGGTCDADIDCDGFENDDVRTIQQRLQFDPPMCDELCQHVTLDDDGAEADVDCVDVTSNTLNEEIWATGEEGTMTSRTIEGEVSCQNCVQPPPPGLPDLEAALEPFNAPDGNVNMVVAHHGGDSYFNATLTNAGEFDGVYDSWCVDTDNTISPGANYCVELISTYSPEAQNLVEKPENLDALNYLLNQNWWGQASACGGTYTYGDIQKAVWTLVENANSNSGVGSYSQCRIDEIVADALANGEGFEPPCEGTVAVIQNPCGNTQSGAQSGVFQITIFQITLSEFVLDCGEPPPVECEECVAIVTNTATLTGDEECEASGLIDPAEDSASFSVTCEGQEPPPPGIEPGDFCSQTQGGWGTDNCNGNNTACLRDAHFDELFASGLVVGDPDGPDADALYAILLTSSAAVADYLPAGGTPAALTADQTDPQTTSSGVFGGQLTAATLNVAFDLAGYGKETPQRTPPPYLGDLVYGDCDAPVADGLLGLSVNEVIALANIAISGGGTPAGVSIADLSDALAALNEEFVDCDTVATGCLDLPTP